MCPLQGILLGLLYMDNWAAEWQKEKWLLIDVKYWCISKGLELFCT